MYVVTQTTSKHVSRWIGVVLLIVLACSCTSSTQNEDTTETSIPSTTLPAVVGEPVTDFNNLFKARNAIDHSYLSVDASGIYGVIVENDFEFMQYLSTGWAPITSTVTGIASDTKGQTIDNVLVEKALTVTTRDYTSDRENDFLIRFNSGGKTYGALANIRNGTVELKPFCLSNPSSERPGMIRVFVLEDLNYNDRNKSIEGADYGYDGSKFKETWKWSRTGKCFKIAASNQ
jgi:hypothetical protein